MPSVLKNPSAWSPIVLSGAALALVLGYVAVFGVVRQTGPADEGAPARLFQLLLAAQAPIIAFFAIRYLPRAPQPALTVLALQVLAALVPVVLVVLLER